MKSCSNEAVLLPEYRANNVLEKLKISWNAREYVKREKSADLLLQSLRSEKPHLANN